jgi:hypothetical protein
VSDSIERRHAALFVHLEWLRGDLEKHALNEHSQERIAWYLGKALDIVRDAIAEAKNGTVIQTGETK